jgi:hypothetical protein
MRNLGNAQSAGTGTQIYEQMCIEPKEAFVDCFELQFAYKQHVELIAWSSSEDKERGKIFIPRERSCHATLTT